MRCWLCPGHAWLHPTGAWVEPIVGSSMHASSLSKENTTGKNGHDQHTCSCCALEATLQDKHGTANQHSMYSRFTQSGGPANVSAQVHAMRLSFQLVLIAYRCQQRCAVGLRCTPYFPCMPYRIQAAGALDARGEVPHPGLLGGAMARCSCSTQGGTANSTFQPTCSRKGTQHE